MDPCSRPSIWLGALGGLLLAGSSAPAVALDQIRIASYNIRFLDADALPTQSGRKARLLQLVDALAADVVGLTEIKDRRALEAIFPASDWSQVIDDDSADDQDLAIVVRRPLEVVRPADLDADDQDFLFSDGDELFFPNRRDLLRAEIRDPASGRAFFVLVTHAKSRLGGRAATDFRREGAAAMIVQRLGRDFDESDYVLLGDFNDNCDDRSLNILETGDVNALGGIEDEPGAFLVNLLEPLCARDQVTLGREPSDIINGRVNLVDQGARVRNDIHRGDNTHTGDQMFDMILASPGMVARYVDGSAAVFDLPMAIEGSEQARASDHLPVYADFDLAREGVDGGDEPSGGDPISIAAVLPNPAGTDEGQEAVTLRNLGDHPVDLGGWRLRDRAANEFRLQGTIAATADQLFVMTEHSMPLNNGGDTVELVQPDGATVATVSYTGDQVVSGQPITFDQP